MKVEVSKQQEFKVTVPPDALEPARLALEKSLDEVEREIARQYTEVNLHHQIDCVVTDGLHAFNLALKEMFQFVSEDRKNTGVEIATGVNQSVYVPFGKFTVPGIWGFLQTNVTGPTTLVITGKTRKMHEEQVHALVARTKELLKTHSIYRGKAIRINTFNSGGLLMPEFLDTSYNGVESLILPDRLMTKVETSLFSRIRYTEAYRARGKKLKRGILLSGPFGTGKTLTAYVTAHLCEKYGWTFLYVKNVDELPQAIEFLQRYQPSVGYCEDLDAALTGERTSDMNSILNIVDGIDTKHSEVMLVLTTNYVEKINPAMLRPGRLDHVIEFTAPDAPTAERLIRYYGGESLEPSIDLRHVAEVCANAKMIPAVIEEVVNRASNYAMHLSKGASDQITERALLEAADSVADQIALVNRDAQEPSHQTKLGMAFEKVSRETMADLFQQAGLGDVH